jgi:3-hydroxyisobutyrate dehydrogenase-like beta-hydroxyacid dehydrogenase
VGASLRVGFVGLGSQGGPMARRIVDEGFPTTLWARRRESLQPFADTNARLADSVRELGRDCDVLGVCVVSDADVDAVLRGPDGALAVMRPGGVVVVHSTTHPDTCRRLQDDHPALHVLDAPVSGGGHRAASRELLVMVGGEPDVLDRVRPVLESFANPLVHLGPLGSGQVGKLLNNALFTAQIGLAADTFALAREHRLDSSRLAAVLAHGSGRSYAAQIVAAAGEDLSAFASNAGPLLAKDVGILTSLQQDSGSPLVAAAREALVRMGAPGARSSV